MPVIGNKSVVITYPTDGAKLKCPFTATGTKPVGCEVEVAIGPLIKKTVSNANNTWSVLVEEGDLNDWKYTMTATCIDTSTGNIQSESSIQIAVDSTPPTIFTLAPLEGATYTPSHQEFHITVYDDISGVDTSTVNIKIDGSVVDDFTMNNVVSAEWPSPNPVYEFVIVRDLPTSGFRNFEFSISDYSGNTAVYGPIRFEIGSFSPVINIVKPYPGKVFGDYPIIFSVTASDMYCSDPLYPGKASFIIDGTTRIPYSDMTSTINNGLVSFEYKINRLPHGAHKWSFDVPDESDVTGSTGDIPFYVDAVGPSLKVVEPANNSFYKTNEVPFVIDAADDNGISTDTYTYMLTVSNSSSEDILDTVVTSMRTENVDVKTKRFSDTIKNLTDGAYTWSFYASDEKANDTTIESMVFTVDTVPPTITIIKPNLGMSYVKKKLELEFNVSDSMSGVSLESYDRTLRIDDVDVPSGNMSIIGVDATTTKFKYITDISKNGEHTFAFTIRDNAGNEATTGKVKFTIDATPPDIVTSVPNGYAFNSKNVSIVFDVSDSLSGVTDTSAFITIDGVEKDYKDLSYADIGEDDEIFRYTYTDPNMSEGVHTYSFRVSDNAGNEATTGEIVFVVDMTPPVISNIDLNGKAIENTYNWIYTTILRNGLSYKVIDNITTYVTRNTYIDGNLVGSSGEVVADYSEDLFVNEINNTTEVNATIDFFARTGKHTIRVECLDRAGNSDEFTLTVIIDKTPPSIEFVEETPGMVYGPMHYAGIFEFNVYDGSGDENSDSGLNIDSLKITLNGEILRPELYIIFEKTKVNGVNWPSGYYYNVSMPINLLADEQLLVDGENEINVEIYDNVKNVANETHFYIFDAAPPVVTITSPVPDQLYTSGPLDVTGYVEPEDIDQFITLTIDTGVSTETVDLRPGEEFSFSIPIDGEEGVYDFFVNASTESGYEEVEVVRFSYSIDTVGPEISDIFLYVNGKLVEEYPLSVEPGTVIEMEVYVSDMGV